MVFKEGTPVDGIVEWHVSAPKSAQDLSALAQDLKGAAQRLAADPALRGAVMHLQGKAWAEDEARAWLALHEAGADLLQIADLARSFGAATRAVERAGKPVVAVLSGNAFGLDCELALAASHRLMRDRVSLGLGQVSLGLMPAAGGGQRLARLISVPEALPRLLQGSPIGAKEAQALGLVYALFEGEAPLPEVLSALIAGAADVTREWDRKGYRIKGGAGPLAPFAADLFQNGTSRLKATTVNAPAARAIQSAIYEGTLVPIDTALGIEADYFATLLAGKVSGNLLRLWLRPRDSAGAKHADHVRPVRKLGILGAGMMGAGIANVAAAAGIEVVLLDQTLEQAARGHAHIAKHRAKERDKGILSPEGYEAILARVTTTDDHALLAGADLIVEAVFENRAVKAQASALAVPHLAEGGIFASNTSTLPITGLAAALPDPSRFIGLHFFSPVERMPLVEVITGQQTSPQTLAQALAFVGLLKKTAIVVHDSPGFYTSRVFCTYIDEAMAMLAEGIAPALIENAARQAGFPVAPLSVTDEVSLDLQKLVLDQAVADSLDARFLRAHAAPVIAKFNELGRLGRKTKAGFYDYDAEGGKRLWAGLAELYPPKAQQPDIEEVKARLLCIQALESARCLYEGVIDDEASADLGSVLGIGYPAWTGGALSLISTMGPEAFAEICARLAAQLGPRFDLTPEVLARATTAASQARSAAKV